MTILEGDIKDYNERGELTIVAKLDNPSEFIKRDYKKCRVIPIDSRKISEPQRKAIHALIGEISDYTGDNLEDEKARAKLEFRLKDCRGMIDDFSLADCNMTIARDFQSHLIDFIIRNDIPCKFPLLDYVDDIERYVYCCLKNKKCVVCGKKAELHHVDHIGMGNDRTEVPHEGREALSLCRAHHNDVHKKGEAEFQKWYHIKPVKLDKELCKIYKLRSK